MKNQSPEIKQRISSYVERGTMGGNFGGTVDPAFTTDQMEIDYEGCNQ